MDKAGPHRDLPDHDETTDRVAERRPAGVSAPTYAEVALKLLDQGYEPLPVTPHSKKVPAARWTTVSIDEAKVEDWIGRFGYCGVGLRTGHLVGIDIDITDPDLAHEATEIVKARLGDTIDRVGRWPKRLLLYRTDMPCPKRQVAKVEVLGLGQQFVAFGLHEKTGLPYDWPSGETPLDRALDTLPLVTGAAIEALLAELQPLAGSAPSGARGTSRGGAVSRGNATRDAEGRVTDGRDSWLSTIAFHVLHDARDRGEEPREARLAEAVWARFSETTDLSRPKQDSRQAYGPDDARRKLRDKLRLYHAGQLPQRKRAEAAPAYQEPRLAVGEARQELDRILGKAVKAIGAWHREGGIGEAPRIGIRATVGLGKSTATRRHVQALRDELKNAGLPHRVLVLVPSLRLADETAAAWIALGINAVVLRGYEAPQPVSREPMCGDVPAVRTAIEAGYDIQSSVCARSGKRQCRLFASCAKQANRRAVGEADVVVAAYDTMFTGFAGDTQDFALLIVDEACWQRSVEVSDDLTVESLPQLGIAAVAPSRRQDTQGAAIADVVAARRTLSEALSALPPGEVLRDALALFGIDEAMCVDARAAEYAALPMVQLSPGQGKAERSLAMERSKMRALGLQVIGLWSALASLLNGSPDARAKVWLGARVRDGQRPICIYRRKAMAGELARLPLLHLDATLRPDLARVGLPGLQVTTVEAQAPHQHVRLITGSFGKSTLCPAPGGGAENQRRRNRLREVVEYVRWHALRHRGGRVLVITYKAIEGAFAAIPGVETAHYNNVAGLDHWGDISALFLVGRPLPSSGSLAELAGAVFDQSVRGDYVSEPIGVALAGCNASAARAIRHQDHWAETLRAAICDDEVLQALGRGRGVNRREDNPLEVHVMADVVLPITMDRVTAWETICPDIVQEMLLAGIAVDSPADAARLHSQLLTNAEQAKKAFQRAGFGGHFPIGDIYREMSLKSALYRNGGRGKTWQRALWIAGTAEAARVRLEAAIGPLDEWKPDAEGGGQS